MVHPSSAKPAAPSIAIIGASADRRKFGNKAVRAYARAGWRVIPVNPAGGEIEGLPVLRSVRDLDEPIDRITIYLPPDAGIKLLTDIAAAKPRSFLLNPGTFDDALLARARELELPAVTACSIVAIGASPGEFPDE